MCATALPEKYTHFIQDLRMPTDNTTSVPGQMKALLEIKPFERPIETFSEDVLRAAFTLKPISKAKTLTLKTDKSHSVAPSVSNSPDNRSPTGLTEAERREKKEKKKRKREKEEAAEQLELFRTLLREMRLKTWESWNIDGKPGNPFIQKITRQNCKSLGVPNYFDYINTPMDLTRMNEKNEKGSYHDFDQFKNDVQLIVANAQVFNRKGEIVYTMADELEALFNEKSRVAIETLASERKRKKKEKKKKKKEKKE